MSVSTQQDAMERQVIRIKALRQELADRKKQYGARSASYLDSRARLKNEEAKLVEMALVYFDSDKS